jgi:hypothetical protein
MYLNVSKIKNLKQSNLRQSVFFRAQNALCRKTVGAIIGLRVSKQDGMVFLFVPNMSKLSKSEHVYPHSILMQEQKVMREKKTKPEIYRELKVTNNGCVWWIMISNQPTDVI